MSDLEDFRVFKSHPGPVMVRFHPSGGRLLRPLLLPTLIRCFAAGSQSHFKEKPHAFQLHIPAWTVFQAIPPTQLSCRFLLTNLYP